MRKKKRPILLLSSVLVLLFGLLLFGRIDVRQADAASDYQELQLFTDVPTIVPSTTSYSAFPPRWTQPSSELPSKSSTHPESAG